MAKYGSSCIIMNKTWAELKSTLLTRNLSLQFDESSSAYEFFAVDDNLVFLCRAYKGNIPSNTIRTPDVVGQAENDAIIADFEANYKTSANKSLTLRTTDGRQRTSAEKSTASRITLFTHNWCDPTSWYTNSLLVTSESISFVSGAYALMHPNVIDTYHGKITGEDYLVDGNNRSYRVSVFADGISLREQDPHYATGGDYVIDYAGGLIIPTSGLAFTGSGTGSIVATYHYATDSVCWIKPTTGKNIAIALAEVQFSLDIGMRDSVSFQPYGLVEYFAPQLCPVPYPSGTLIPLGAAIRYKTMSDFLNESMRTYPVYPPLGGDGWRAMKQPSVVMDWDYVASQVIYSKTGMQVRIKLDHDVPFSGSFATVSFYCTVEDA